MKAGFVVAVVAGCGFHAPASTDGSVAGDGAIDAPPDAPGCPASYGPLAGAPSRYRVVGGGMGSPQPGRTNWLGAEGDCRDDGFATHLAVTETAPEHQAFVDVLSGASRWLGVTDRKVEGTWVPIIPTSGWYPKWAGGTPGVDDCLLLSRTNMHEAMPRGSTDPQWNKVSFASATARPSTRPRSEC